MSLARRSVTSATWRMSANLIRVAVLFVRSILLARMLPVEVFGIYALANSVVILTIIFTNFGMAGAFLHRAPETEDESEASAVHFTLKSIFTAVWAILLTAAAFLLTEGETRVALLVLTFTTAGVHLAQTPQLILTRRVVHRRLALIELLTAALTTVVALGLAWQGATLWALLATDLVALVLTIGALYVWRPVWRPRFTWSPPLMRYFLRFGSRTLSANVLLRALDRVDDLWTGIFLGEEALGFYSKAYSFATYPRLVLARPINMVAVGTYAELKGDRERLSRAFFRTNAFLVRSGFFLAGLLALIAPEFIRILLGAKWLPMLDAFRLMLVFTLLDPIKITVSNLFVAVGHPEQVVRARLIQLAVLIVGLFTMGPSLGIAGVALAVDAMLLVGTAILLMQARSYVDFSVVKLFGVPMLALILALVLAVVTLTLPNAPTSDWYTAGVKIGVFTIIYVGTLILLERETIPMFLGLLRHLQAGHIGG